MSLRLVFSNRTERLLEAFATDVQAGWGAPGDRLFTPTRVIAPNVNVSAWLKFGLARLHGIAANLDVVYLQRFVRELLERAHPGVHVLTGSELHAKLLGTLLDDDVLKRKEFQPVRAWLKSAASGSTGELRRFELAGQVQKLFEEYAWQRPDVLRDWGTRAAFQDTPYAATEAWQRALWNGLFPDESKRLNKGPVPEIVSPVGALRLLADRPGDRLPARINAFGISYLAPAYLELFGRLADRTDVHLYVLNPCREFWDDVESVGERRSRLRRAARTPESLDGDDPFHLANPAESLPLQLWGRPGREHVRLLHALTDCDFDDAFEPPDGDSLLHRLQADILNREVPKSPAKTGGYAAPDDSLVLLSTPGIRREAEAVADEVWRFVREDHARAKAEGRPPVRFDELAVVVAGPEPEQYFAHISAAFQESHDLPCSISDLPFGARGGVSEVVQRLLDLPASRFTRDDVSALLVHPLVHARAPDADPVAWERLAQQLGIAFGLDAADHQGTYLAATDPHGPPPAQLFHWDQALRRLAVGLTLGAPDSGPVQPFLLGEERLLPAPQEGSDAGAGAFLLLARSLLSDAAFAREATLTLPEWADFLGEFLRSYVVTTLDADAADLSRCLDALSRLADLDADQQRVPFAVAREFALQELGTLSGSKGRWLADGVVVSALQPMRAIPFRAVFVMGLDEQRFPRRDTRSRLDLRAARRRAGDVTPREQDAYLFLETLLCARERLVLSWLGRDPSTGDPLEPSSVVADLRRTLDDGYLGPRGSDALVRTLPLRRFDPRLHPDVATAAGRTGEHVQAVVAQPTQPSAAIEARALALRDHLDAHLTGLPPVGWRDVERALDPVRFAPIAALLGQSIPTAPPPPLLRKDEVVRLSLKDLEAFLRCPLQGHAKVVLRLARDEEDEAPVEDEPIDVSALDDTMRLRSTLSEVLRSGANSAEIPSRIDELLERERLSGALPVGVFGEVARERLQQLVTGWSAQLDEALPGHGAARTVRYGRTLEHDVADERLPALRFEVPGEGGKAVVVELSASLMPRLATSNASVSGTRSDLKRELKKTPPAPKHLFPHLLEHAFVAAAGASGEGAAVLCGTIEQAPVVHVQPFGPLPEERATQLLKDLCADLLSGPHPYLFPVEAVSSWRFGKGETWDDAASGFVDELSGGKSYACRGPVPRPESYDPVDAMTAEALWNRRWKPLFDAVSETSDDLPTGTNSAGSAGEKPGASAAEPRQERPPATEARVRATPSPARPEPPTRPDARIRANPAGEKPGLSAAEVQGPGPTPSRGAQVRARPTDARPTDARPTDARPTDAKPTATQPTRKPRGAKS